MEAGGGSPGQRGGLQEGIEGVFRGFQMWIASVNLPLIFPIYHLKT